MEMRLKRRRSLSNLILFEAVEVDFSLDSDDVLEVAEDIVDVVQGMEDDGEVSEVFFAVDPDDEIEAAEAKGEAVQGMKDDGEEDSDEALEVFFAIDPDDELEVTKEGDQGMEDDG